MRLLLDTHLLIWVAGEEERLSKMAFQLLEDEANDHIFSVVSIWEIAIKRTVARDAFDIEPTAFRRGLLKIGFEELSITSEHAIATGALPLIHRDPFDRLLMAQATIENLTFLTADTRLARYPGPVRHV